MFPHLSIHNSSTQSHPSEKENRTRNRSKLVTGKVRYLLNSMFAVYFSMLKKNAKIIIQMQIIYLVKLLNVLLFVHLLFYTTFYNRQNPITPPPPIDAPHIQCLPCTIHLHHLLDLFQLLSFIDNSDMFLSLIKVYISK